MISPNKVASAGLAPPRSRSTWTLGVISKDTHEQQTECLPKLRPASHTNQGRCHFLSVVVASSLSLGSPFVLASEPTASEAKAEADRSEASLSKEQLQALTKAQGDMAATAFPACAAQAAVPASFTVVVELAATGKVINSWVLGESPFARCFRGAMARSFFFQPPRVPFFTSFEYSPAAK